MVGVFGRPLPYFSGFLLEKIPEKVYNTCMLFNSTNAIKSATAIFGLGSMYLGAVGALKADLKAQLLELFKKSPPYANYNTNIPLLYRIFAKGRYGITAENWQGIYNDASEVAKNLDSDKTTAMRSLFWYMLALVCIVISIFF